MGKPDPIGAWLRGDASRPPRRTRGRLCVRRARDPMHLFPGACRRNVIAASASHMGGAPYDFNHVFGKATAR